MRRASLPLGVDIGSTRLRVLHAVSTIHGPRLRAVAVRSLSAGCATSGRVHDPEYVATLLEEAVAELRTKERRCVCSVGEPDALLRSIALPKMTAPERERAARLEAQRHVSFPIAEATVRVHPASASGTWALGIARHCAVSSRVASLRGAGLKPLALDHEACAFGRALPGFDAVVDVGHQRSGLHVMSDDLPSTLQTYSGGADITSSIRRELSVDEQTAEKRKRILGTAGAGERARASLTADIAALVRTARQTHVIGRIALVGNAARLPGLAPDLQDATGALCETPIAQALRSDEYPDDVVRSSAPDWTLAAGLAMWVTR